MSENGSENQNNGKSNKGIIIALIVIIVLLIAGGATVVILGIQNNWWQEEQSVGIKEEPNMFFDDESADEYLKSQKAQINVSMNARSSIRTAEGGKKMLVVGIENTNDFQCKIDVNYGGQLIAETGLVQPGQRVPEIELKEGVNFEPGTYELSVVFTAISPEDNQTSRGSTGVVSELIVG